MGLVERLREPIIGPAILDGRIDGALGERLIRERHDAADTIERLLLFEAYANRDIEAQVEAAIEMKRTTGKYPFED